jgi:DNA repair protein RecO (recombination protein O)
MSERRVLLQPVYVLHQRPYRDTSALVELFSPQHGRVGVVARGVRGSRSRWRGVLQVFQPLLASWTQRGELGTLIDLEPQGPSRPLPPAHIASGFYLNELLMRLLGRHDPHPPLYQDYDASLRALADIDAQAEAARAALEALLRRFELRLLGNLGYGLVLEHDTEGAPLRADQQYVYALEQGPLPAGAGAGGVAGISGASLCALAAEDFSAAQTRHEAKLLLRAVLGHHLGGKPLLSRQLLQPVKNTPSAAADTRQENPRHVSP